MQAICKGSIPVWKDGKAIKSDQQGPHARPSTHAKKIGWRGSKPGVETRESVAASHLKRGRLHSHELRATAGTKHCDPIDSLSTQPLKQMARLCWTRAVVDDKLIFSDCQRWLLVCQAMDRAVFLRGIHTAPSGQGSILQGQERRAFLRQHRY